jgi:aryl-alcohol dehydrogenase-like predicted oxidoreductase
VNSQKLILGAAQLGMDYGINNLRGQIPADEVKILLDTALNHGIDTIDTAFNYGNSERVIGQYLFNSQKEFKMISKLPHCDASEIEGYFYKSLAFLNIDRFYGYLLHDFQAYINDPGLWRKLEILKKEGKVEKIGFSLYYPQQLDLLIERKVAFDLLQVPYSVFDRRFEDYFPALKKAGIEVNVRSVFLQGLVFKKIDEMSGQFNKIKHKMTKLRAIADQNKQTVAAACLGFTLANNKIDKVVIGVDSLENLKDIISIAGNFNKNNMFADNFSELEEQDEQILLPFNWQKVHVEMLN